ncbi:MAG: ATP-binding cassette domain-containing protein [Syntrophomonadaceae bacterium]|nr:ATP-binding cassette domain-containing protein [Syntrophomonadaceae bacterium]
MLRLEDVSVRVTNGEGAENGGPREILHNINVEFERGRLYAITGPNGGGKTSLAKTIMGIYPNHTGRIIFDGEDISGMGVTERARRGIGYAFQQPPRFKGITIDSLLALAAPEADPSFLRAQLRGVGLCPEDYVDRDLGTGLSGGEVKRIEVAQLLLRNCPLAIFDEPEAGVDLWTIQQLITLILNSYHNNSERLAIIISHNEKILPICDEIIVIDEGQITGRGTAEEIWHLIRDEVECKAREHCRGGVVIC